MLLPISLDVKNKRCLVVGGGLVAARKVASLLECGARVHVVSPALCDELARFTERIEYSKRAFLIDDCVGNSLVFACTNRRDVNAEVADAARRNGIWCNIADDATNSDFHGAATIRRGEISIAISTNGGSPALSRHLKAKIESAIGDEYAQLLNLMSAARANRGSEIGRNGNRVLDEAQANRAEKWRAILQSDVLELLRNGANERAAQKIDEILNDPLSNEL